MLILRVLCFMSLMFLTSMVNAYIASADYVRGFYTDMCNNPDLDFANWPGNGVASVQYAMQIIDSMNTNSTPYDSTIAGNAVSVGWMNESLSMLTESMTCCLGGVVGWGTGECWSCGVWMRAESYKCTDAGVYRNGTKCDACPAGWICPAGTAGRVMCGAGFYCTDNVRHECEFGLRQCPYNAHTSAPAYVACDNTVIMTTTPDTACVDAGVYRNGTTCETCPDGWYCPAGTSGRIMCGAGFYCAGGVRTRCDGGVTQCPNDFHATQPVMDETTE